MQKVKVAEAVAEKIGVSPQTAVGLIESVIDTLKQRLRTGETVKIPRFGSFSVRAKRARIGRNPRTGVAAEITARRVVTFHPSRVFREMVNNAQAPVPSLEE